LKASEDKLDLNTIRPELFISDLHLCASRPEITEAFLYFLKYTAVKANALYILGDLFEYWAGDDEIDDIQHQTTIHALRDLANSGVKLYLMHGNRDFLISSEFCRATNISLLQDPTIIDLHSQKVLLTHGDNLCTDDVAYQDFRKLVRDVKWQTDFLSLPLATRKNEIQTIRIRSEHEKLQKSSEIMDVNNNAVNDLLKKYNYPNMLIHGHTHRPNIHAIQLDGRNITRLVLGDWYEQGSYLSCDQNGCNAIKVNVF
jgi:UDP-2,3-diacylglucosamine hydrolase